MYSNYYKKEKKTYEDYWNEIREYFGYKDSIEYKNGEEELEGHELIVFKNSVGCTLSIYDIDTETAYYW